MRISPLTRTLLAALLASSPSLAAQAKVLFLTKSSGFTHPVVRRAEASKAAFAELQLRRFAAPQFEVDCTQDCSAINAKNLTRYQAVVFYTTGKLPIPDSGKQALFEFVRNGGGFVGIHSATDTLYQDQDYGDLIGGYFDGHPWNQPVTLIVKDQSHPAMALLGEKFEIHDEIYKFKNFIPERVQVLLQLDTSKPYMKRDKAFKPGQIYPNAWCRSYEEGRMFYTALGHGPNVWRDRRFLKHLTSGIRWAMQGSGALAKPPKNAIRLFDGVDLDAWTHANGKKDAGFTVADDVMTVAKGGGSMITRRQFRDFRLHLEFRSPSMPNQKGQKKGNSGVYIQRRYEVQILDTHGLGRLKNGCAALYRQRAPDANVCKPANVWQTYDIWFRAARFDQSGKKTKNARITLIHNDVMVHDDVELTNKTGAGRKEGPEPGPILLQDHGDAVSFRNVWIVPQKNK